MRTVLNTNRLSIVEGGPLDRLQVRLGLMTLQKPRILRRAFVFALIAWLPLIILSALQGVVLESENSFLLWPFCLHPFLAIRSTSDRCRSCYRPADVAATSHFITSGLIPEERYQDFDSAIVDTIRRRDSTVAEVILLAITYFSAFMSIRFFSSDVSTWQSLVVGSGHRFMLASYWYALVSIPIYQFLVYRWLWRTLIWCRFLQCVSILCTIRECKQRSKE